MAQLIYIVEDDSSISKLYECTFENSGYLTACFENAEDMFVALKKQTPSIIIMDLMLPGMDGISAIKMLKNSVYDKIPVIIISANGEETIKVKGLNIGAEDYIEKPFGVLELTARIKKVLSRQNINSLNEVLSFDNLHINTKKHIVTVSGNKIDLTPKEFDILLLLLTRKNEVVKREEIFDIIWGKNYFIETRTLDIHIKSLRKKLIKYSDKEFIKTIRGIGYIIE